MRRPRALPKFSTHGDLRVFVLTVSVCSERPAGEVRILRWWHHGAGPHMLDSTCNSVAKLSCALAGVAPRVEVAQTGSFILVSKKPAQLKFIILDILHARGPWRL